MTTIPADEKMVMKIRRHWFVIASEASGVSAMFFVPLVLYLVALKSDFGGLIIPGDTTYLAIALFSMWGLFVWLLFCKMWTDYILDVWIITDKSLIDVEQRGFFNREISTLRLEKIQDVTVHVVGIMPSFLRFGQIRVQTAGASREFIMHDIENPHLVKSLILRLHDEAIEKGKTVQLEHPIEREQPIEQ